jgi:hypothetical protein
LLGKEIIALAQNAAVISFPSNHSFLSGKEIIALAQNAAVIYVTLFIRLM